MYPQHSKAKNFHRAASGAQKRSHSIYLYKPICEEKLVGRPTKLCRSESLNQGQPRLPDHLFP
jgi:hypothetical protein